MLPLLQIQNVILSPDIFTVHFCCDLEACKGQCCVEGESGAPITLDEVALLEDAASLVWSELTARAQSIIDKEGVCYSDKEGELVTQIVDGRDCVFAINDTTSNCCLCAIDKACRTGQTEWPKPISCALYPIREKKLNNGLIALNYNQWSICKPALEKGKNLNLPLYIFLKEPLVRRFGQEWYDELLTAAEELRNQGII